jgi:molybdopterin adenylyltransferase
MAEINVAILTCSDTRGEAEDTAGRALSALIAEHGWTLSGYQVVPDDKLRIEAVLIEMADAGADIILTCGGTGLGPRDVTPEATLAVCERRVPGIAEHMRAESLKVTGRAMLSRATAAARGRTLVINLPGSEKAARECFGFVADQFEHAVKMMNGGGH